LFFIAALGAAQQPEESWYYGKVIKRIEFDGLKNVKASDLEGITRPFYNQAFSDDLYNDLFSRLSALDYFDFDTIDVLPADDARQTLTIRFTVKERPIVARLSFVGNREIRTTDLKEKISIKEKDIYIESRVLLDERAIREHYLKNGYTGVEVSSRTAEIKNGIEVTFVINEGASTIITGIQFQGNTVVTPRRLKGLLESKEHGLIRKGAFQESSLELDRGAIITYYRDRGYADVSVEEVMRETVFNEKESRNEVTLTYIIHEGIQYTYGGIEITGNTLFTTEQLEALIRLKEGAVFNYTRFQEGIAAIIDLYYENGYTSNAFVPEIIRDPEKRLVSATYRISEQPRSHIEHIIVRGNEKTKPEVILRELQLETGDIFSKTRVQNGLRNLMNLQYFSNIVPDVVPGSEENLVDVIVNVEEQSTTSVEFGLTFTGVNSPEDFPISLFVKFQDSNIFGTGRTVSADGTLSPDQQSLALGYSDSWFLGLPLGISVSADVTHRNLTALQRIYYPGSADSSNHYMDYEQWAFTLAAGVGRRWFPDFAILSLNGGISSSLLKNIYDAKLYEPVDSTIAEYEQLWTLKNTIWSSFSIDNRDVNYDPSRGWFASQRIAWTGLLPKPVETEFFFRTDTKGELYFTLLNQPITDTWSLKFVLMESTGLSFQFPVRKDTLGATSMLYADGMFVGRGWMTYMYNKDIRDTAMWTNLLELRMPLIPGILAFDFFFDIVAIKKDSGKYFSTLTEEDFYFSFGPGLRFSIPQFPIRFLFGFAFKQTDHGIQWLNSAGTEIDSNSPQPVFVLSFNLPNR
jgi:outer membrane protein insertion porin family